MQLLEVKSNTQDILFNISEDKQKSVKDLDREDLFKMMNALYENPEYYTFVEEQDLDVLNNDLVKEMAKQIQKELKDFHSNASFLRGQIEGAFPELDDQTR